MIVADAYGTEGPLGFGFEEVESGLDDQFYFVMRVSEVQPGSWAEKNGITIGCIIQTVNGEDVMPMTGDSVQEVLERVRPLHLVLWRPESVESGVAFQTTRQAYLA